MTRPHDVARRFIMRTVTRSLGLAACACVVASLITVRLRAEDQRRENPANKERQRRRSELGAAGLYRPVLVAD